jgi:hypothetical protein
MSADYDHFLKTVCAEMRHVERVTSRLLTEKKIDQAARDAIVAATMHVLVDAYQAGRSEPAGVTDLVAELTRVSP